jgi:hypothetical protein
MKQRPRRYFTQTEIAEIDVLFHSSVVQLEFYQDTRSDRKATAT